MRKLGLVALLAGGLMLAAAADAQAQRRGYGGWGGGYGGYGWGGRGYSFGMGTPYYSGYYGGGYYPGGYSGIYGPYYGGYGRGYATGYGYPYYGGAYYNNYSSYPGTTYNYPYGTTYSYSPGYTSSPGYTTTYSGYAQANTPAAYQSQSYYAGPSQSDNRAYVRVIVPRADAQVFFDGKLTQQQGMERFFHSPALQGDGNYTYTIRATWMENGKEVSREKQVQVRPGQETIVRLTDADTDATPGRTTNPATDTNLRRDQTPDRGTNPNQGLIPRDTNPRPATPGSPVPGSTPPPGANPGGTNPGNTNPGGTNPGL